jgi:hypothetical protein
MTQDSTNEATAWFMLNLFQHLAPNINRLKQIVTRDVIISLSERIRMLIFFIHSTAGLFLLIANSQKLEAYHLQLNNSNTCSLPVPEYPASPCSSFPGIPGYPESCSKISCRCSCRELLYGHEDSVIDVC